MSDAIVESFEQQLGALQLRLATLVTTERWDDLVGRAHDRAFVVAGAMKADLLKDLASAVGKSIQAGGTIQSFRKDFDSLVKKNGWDYKGDRNWRTRVIYTTNMSTTYAAGRLSQLKDPELQKVAPFWMYRHGGSSDPRPVHVKWDKLVLNANDPWWLTHYPPNGWGCSCRVTAVSKQTAQRLGAKILEEAPLSEPGEIGEGWNYAPGASITTDLQDMVQQKSINLPKALASALLADVVDILGVVGGN